MLFRSRVVLCTGKVYFDLLEDREKRGVDDVYLLRVEQIFPTPLKSLVRLLSRFKNAEVVWCQEEPKNQGAFSFVAPYIESVMEQLGRKGLLRYTGRKASASPAVGQASLHQAELAAFLNDALTL